MNLQTPISELIDGPNTWGSPLCYCPYLPVLLYNVDLSNPNIGHFSDPNDAEFVA